MHKAFCYLDSLRLKDPTHVPNTDNGSPPTFSSLEAINPAGLQPCSRYRHGWTKVFIPLNILPAFQACFPPPPFPQSANSAFRNQTQNLGECSSYWPFIKMSTLINATWKVNLNRLGQAIKSDEHVIPRRFLKISSLFPHPHKYITHYLYNQENHVPRVMAPPTIAQYLGDEETLTAVLTASLWANHLTTPGPASSPV